MFAEREGRAAFFRRTTLSRRPVSTWRAAVAWKLTTVCDSSARSFLNLERLEEALHLRLAQLIVGADGEHLVEAPTDHEGPAGAVALLRRRHRDFELLSPRTVVGAGLTGQHLAAVGGGDAPGAGGDVKRRPGRDVGVADREGPVRHVRAEHGQRQSVRLLHFLVRLARNHDSEFALRVRKLLRRTPA